MLETTEVVTGTRQCVTFKLDLETYAIDVMQIREILRSGEIVPVPGAPASVLGIINLRGNVVTVIDARQCFALGDHEADDAQRIIIVEIDDQVCGIRVDSVAEVIEIAESDIEPPPAVGREEQAHYIEGVTSCEEDLVILVDLNRLLDEDQWQAVAGG